MRVLITGSQGFLGRYLVAHLLNCTPEIEIMGIGRSSKLHGHFTHEISWNDGSLQAPLTPPLIEILASPRYQYRQLCLTETEKLNAALQEFQPQFIIHLAAALRDDHYRMLFESNVIGCLSLLEAIATSKIKMPFVILGSTGFLYGDRPENELPRREDYPVSPIDLYGISKRAAEDSARLLARQHGIPTIWARIFNPLGPGQDERHFCGWIAMQVASIAAGNQDAIIKVGNLDSSRDFLDIRDTAQALEVLMNKGEPGEIYNVASGIETVISDVFIQLLTLAGIENRISVEKLPPRPADLPRHYADITKLKKLGFCAQYSLSKSLEHVLDYYVNTVSSASP